MANQDYDAANTEFSGSKAPTAECGLCEAPIFGDGKSMIEKGDLGRPVLVHVCVECYEYYREFVGE